MKSFKLESLAEVGKSQAKLERTERSWKEISMMNFPTSVTTFQVHSNLPTSARTFQMRRNFQKKLSNFARFFPTSLGSFQLQSVLSNFAWLFPTSAKLSNFRLSNLKLSNFSFFPTALSNYTYPKKSPKKSNL